MVDGFLKVCTLQRLKARGCSPELAEQVWATHPGIKVLFTSGYTGDSISNVNNYPTPANFLPKPYMPEALAVKVREVLDQRAS